MRYRKTKVNPRIQVNMNSTRVVGIISLIKVCLREHIRN